jgi:hypothetical protein
MDHQQMIAQLEQYRQENGFYDLVAITAAENPGEDSLSITFGAFFGDGDDDTPATDGPLAALARELNGARAEQQKREREAKASAILAKDEAGEELTGAEMRFLVGEGLAYEVFDDPDSNRPTGIIIGRLGDGNPYADQVDH